MRTARQALRGVAKVEPAIPQMKAIYLRWVEHLQAGEAAPPELHEESRVVFNVISSAWRR